jgi:hypothetical protein
MSLRNRLPSLFPLLQNNATLKTIVDALDDELQELEADIDGVQDSLFVNTADGQSLDLIGDDFGPIGQRRGRDDEAFRQFLRSVVPAFDGRGTERDVEVAVAAGVAVDPDEIDLRQQFADVTYQVELFDWTAHQTGTVHELADLADPAAVQRIDPLYYFSDEIAIVASPGSTETGIGTVAGTASPALTADGTTASLFAVGLSSDDLGALSTDGFILSIREAPAARIVFDAAGVELATNPDSPTATARAGAEATAVRQMTRLSGATPAVDSGATAAATLTRDGLASVQLGGLSTTQIPPLST